MIKYFPSARSKILGLIIWGFLLIVFGFAFSQVFRNSTFSQLIIVSSIFIIIFLFMGTVWFGTGYFISDDILIIKIGPVTHSRIRISRISKISRTNSILASPANSLKRLAIKSGKRVIVMISPKDEDAFIISIKEANPKILLDLK